MCYITEVCPHSWHVLFNGQASRLLPSTWEADARESPRVQGWPVVQTELHNETCFQKDKGKNKSNLLFKLQILWALVSSFVTDFYPNCIVVRQVALCILYPWTFINCSDIYLYRPETNMFSVDCSVQPCHLGQLYYPVFHIYCIFTLLSACKASDQESFT